MSCPFNRSFGGRTPTSARGPLAALLPCLSTLAWHNTAPDCEALLVADFYDNALAAAARRNREPNFPIAASYTFNGNWLGPSFPRMLERIMLNIEAGHP